MGLNVGAFLNTVSSRLYSLPVVILYVTEECNLQCITCSYRNAVPGELSLEEIEKLAEKLHAFGLKHVAFSGGEPLTRRDFPAICSAFQRFQVKQTLLTNGLLLEKRLPEVASSLSEIVVSLDGADAATHNAIRGATVFDRIIAGIKRTIREAPGIQISIRTVVQKKNFRQLPSIVGLGHSLGVHHVSFLAADLATDAFGRVPGSVLESDTCVTLDSSEVDEFRQLVEQSIRSSADDFTTGFIAQSPEGLRHIAAHYAGVAGLGPFPPTRCNAPMVSAVISSTGVLKPCFFLPRLGNIRTSGVDSILNSSEGRAIRGDVKKCSPAACKTCVCTLHVSAANAFLNRF